MMRNIPTPYFLSVMCIKFFGGLFGGLSTYCLPPDPKNIKFRSVHKAVLHFLFDHAIYLRKNFFLVLTYCFFNKGTLQGVLASK